MSNTNLEQIESKLNALLDKLEQIERKLNTLEQIESDTLLTPNEAAAFLKISRSTLERQTKKGLINKIQKRNKNFYSKRELLLLK